MAERAINGEGCSSVMGNSGDKWWWWCVCAGGCMIAEGKGSLNKDDLQEKIGKNGGTEGND